MAWSGVGCTEWSGRPERPAQLGSLEKKGVLQEVWGVEGDEGYKGRRKREEYRREREGKGREGGGRKEQMREKGRGVGRGEYEK